MTTALRPAWKWSPEAWKYSPDQARDDQGQFGEGGGGAGDSGDGEDGARVLGSLPSEGELAIDVEVEIQGSDEIEGRKASDWPEGVHALPDSAITSDEGKQMPHPASDRRAVARPETKRFIVPFAIKAESIDAAARTFEGLASVWGQDLGDDVMHKGAFATTIKDWKKSGDALPLLNSHDHYNIMSAIGQLLDAKETVDGLWTKWEVVDGPDGDAVLTRLRPSARTGRAPVSKMSIGYEPMKFDMEQSDAARFGTLRNLREVKLVETSLVLFPMTPGASINVQSVKAFMADVVAADSQAVDADTKAEFRRLASRIGLLLAPPKKKAAAEDEEDEPIVEAPPAPPAPPVIAAPPTPAAEDEPNPEEKHDAYLYAEALQQRMLRLRLHSVSHSTGNVQ